MALEKYLSRNWLCHGVIGLFVVLLWGQTLGYGFVWDDKILIAQNRSIRSLKNLPAIFTSVNAQSAEAAPSFRPIRTTFYALLYAAGGGEARPWIFHLSNILWHATAAMLLFSVALALAARLAGETPLAARITALLLALGFAGHPVVSEAVCWAKCLDDLMAGVFVLASARSLLLWTPGGRGYGAAVAWFLLASFAKESAVPFALVVVLILRGVHQLPWRRCARRTAPFLLAALFYVVWRRCVIGQSSQCPPLSGSYGQTLIDMLPTVEEYARLLCGIPPFCADYYFMLFKPPQPWLSRGVLDGAALLLGGGALAAWMWRRPRWRLSALGLLWIALFMLPVSNLVPMMQYMAERFLYLPLMGFLLTLGGACLNFGRLRAAAAWAGALLVLLWAVTSLVRMGVWRDEVTLFVSAELEHPGIKRVETNAVVAIFQLEQVKKWQTARNFSAKDADEMIDTLQKARRIYPENDILSMQLGMVYARMKQWREAVSWMELATRQNPDSAERWYDLASIDRLAGRAAAAREANARALRLNPKYEEALRLQTKLDEAMRRGPPPNSPAPK